MQQSLLPGLMTLTLDCAGASPGVSSSLAAPPLPGSSSLLSDSSKALRKSCSLQPKLPSLYTRSNLLTSPGEGESVCLICKPGLSPLLFSLYTTALEIVHMHSRPFRELCAGNHHCPGDQAIQAAMHVACSGTCRALQSTTYGGKECYRLGGKAL